MAQYKFTKIDVEDGSKSDFIANFGEKLANSFIKAMKSPNMPNACKNIDKWNKFYRLAKEEKLKGEELITFVELDCDTILNEFDSDYMDEFVDTNDVEKALKEVLKKYQSEEDSIEAQIEEICQMPEADNVRYLGEDNGWKCYEILSPEASVKYGLKVGGKAKWCISGGYFDGEKDVLEEAEKYFYDYQNKFDTYYFIIGHGTKFAICPYGDKAQIWDQKDNEVDGDAIPEPPLNIKELRDYLFTVNYDKVCDIASIFVEGWENEHIPVLKEDLRNYLSNMLPQDYTDKQVGLYFDEVERRLKRYHITVYNDIEEYYVSDDFKEVTPKEEYDKIINEPLSKEDLMGFTPKEIFEDAHFREMPYRKQDLLGKKTYDIIMDYFRKDGYNIVRETFDRLYENNYHFKFFKVQGYEDSLKKIQDYAKQNFFSFSENENPHFAHASVINQNTEDELGGGYTSDFKSYLEHAKYLFLRCRSSSDSTHLYMYDDNESLAGMLGIERFDLDWTRVLRVVNQRADHDNVEMFKQVRKDAEDMLSKLK